MDDRLLWRGWDRIGVGLWTLKIVSTSVKYCDHLPLNRQSGIYRPRGRRPGSIDPGRLGRTGRLAGGAYAGFDKLCEPDPITGRPCLVPVACWAHARRELFDEHAKTKSPIARQALDKIGAIFAVEREINGRSAAVRLAARQAQSVPLLADLKNYLEASLGRISRKVAKAIRYNLNRWEALCRFTQDGRLEMTNNAAARAIRPLTLGRRNWTFLGSDSGGERAAVFYTLIQACKLNGINPEAYLADLIGRVGDHPVNRIDELS
ncbi:conserved hypothetical protein [Mesorhizobium plurifarium]|uniref:Uncharacterized protein n=1 Tax=Mesorhizobium plurifarium TaxID=69974 RepID=A0A090DV57_MESPL|nr:conserved hypothetical protein [Mesorhizobium plurifarium]